MTTYYVTRSIDSRTQLFWTGERWSTGTARGYLNRAEAEKVAAQFKRATVVSF